MACPAFETIADLVDGRLSPADTASVERHLADGCRACAGTAEWYRAFVATATADRSLEPPAWMTQRAIDLFAEAREAAAQRGMKGLFARLRASLVFDSLVGGATADAMPARGVGAESRQLLYMAPLFDVDMLVAPLEGAQRLLVTGQVLSSSGAGFEGVGGLTVELERNGEVAAVAETSDFGEFAFEGVEPGLYDLRLGRGSREIVIVHAPIALQ
jgi:hypothetical protein